MMRNINSNKTISFLFPKTISIDLEGLNLLAGKTESILCGCSYCEYNGKHRLDYDLESLENLHLHGETFSLEMFIQACLEMFSVLDRHNLNIVNIKTENQYLFKGQDKYQFLYVPLIKKRKITKRKFVLKLFAQFKNKDARINNLLKQVKILKTDESVLSYLKELVAYTQKADVPESEGETSILSQSNVVKLEESESETTFLSQPENEEPQEDDGTTILTHQTTEFLPSESAECETTFLSEGPLHVERKAMEKDGQYTLFLLRVGTGEQIHINKFPYSIGKDVKTMNYVLGNQSVSRDHASIYIEDNKFYLTDNGSTNGTTIEGIRVQLGERAELSDGDIISLGNEVFQVLLERK